MMLSMNIFEQVGHLRI